jgi:hypothetical protein
MFDIKSTAKELDRLLHDIVVKQGVFVPITKDLLKYKNYTLKRNDDHDWIVLHTVNGKKQHISTVCLKVSAFAVCKLHEKRLAAKLAEVIYQDTIFKKHYIDSLFYKRTAQISQNEITKDNATWRYEIANAEAQAAKKKIDNIFYALIV